MDKSMVDLYVKFKKIRNMGYIKGINNSQNSSGLTFEALLGKEKDEFFLPDYNGIEIKTKKGYSKSKITLFTANPDSMYLYALKNLVTNYGVDGKRFLTEFSSLEKHRYNGHYFKIIVDWKKKVVALLIYDKRGVLISNEVYWTFDLLEERLTLKLSKLALVKCCTKKIDGIEHYWYYRIYFYKDVNFKKFLQAIEKGIITIRFSVGIYLTGPRAGEIHNHGIGFLIAEENLKDIYTPIFNNSNINNSLTTNEIK